MDGYCILIDVQRNFHEMLQSYLDKVYISFDHDIKKTLHFNGNQIYGEILYYSAIKLIKHLNLKPDDNFLDIGSGLGKLALYIYFASQVQSVTGIEINSQRHLIATRIRQVIEQQLPRMFEQRTFTLLEGDFLQSDFEDITVVYICSTIFSYELLEAMGKKLNQMTSIKKIASFRKLPHLSHFKLVKKLLIHCSWERVGCYIYERIA